MQNFKNLSRNKRIIFAGILLALLALGLLAYLVSAGSQEQPKAQVSPLHPTFAFLDANEVNVLESGQPVSTMKTCGVCHDTAYIEQHNFHADLGLADIQANKQITGRSWDFSNGAFGNWDPLTYRYLSQKGDQLLDLGTPEWLMLFGGRIAGGGPATTGRNGLPLTEQVAQKSNPETSYLNATTGTPEVWNWSASGTEEIDCFLCHMQDPNNAARMDVLKNGDFQWANTATLLESSLVTAKANGDLTWNPEAFDENSQLLPENVSIQSPSNANCAQCHGLIHTDSQPLTISDCSLDNPQTAVTGQVISGDKISESGVNLANKGSLTQAWDIHAERQVDCVDCHYSLNNPIAYQESSATRPESLLFDPRHLDFGEYLKYPDHNIARGQSAQTNVAPELKGTMRRCDSCHAAESIHASWLPYTEKHLATLACETCHIPQMYAPAIQSYDWTVLTMESTAASTCRGVENNGGSVNDLVTGFQPVLMMRQNVDGDTLVSPYNLVTAWYWVYDDANGSTRPVRLVDLQAVYFENGSYSPEIMAAFDYDGDANLATSELRVDTAEKQTLITGRLQALGLKDPRITADIQPYSINHGVVTGQAALSDCRACHTENSRLSQSIHLADYIPGGVMPEFVTGTNVTASGSFEKFDKALLYKPEPAADDLYIFGHSSYGWVDWLGGLFFLAVLFGVSAHGGLRMVKAARSKKTTHEGDRIYMYHAYERFWHWLQTALIIILLLTGLVIHRPDLFGGLSFHGLVTIHNVSAAILAINAFLSLFYHLTTGEIRSFIPRPYGFFDDSIEQTKYYLRGIFKHAPHPFEKSPARKMNPLQQVTYLGILNVLLPLQGITGILMWGAQKWTRVATFLGGLPGLAAFHTLVAWLFAAFIVAHVYLTTTGGTRALDSIKAMVTGWEDVEIHEQEASEQIKSQDSEEK